MPKPLKYSNDKKFSGLVFLCDGERVGYESDITMGEAKSHARHLSVLYGEIVVKDLITNETVYFCDVM